MENYFVDTAGFNEPAYLEGYSPEAQELQEQMLNAWIHFYDPLTRTNPIKRFCTLTATWKQANPFTSSITEIATHPAYQEIIGMGPIVIPLIFKTLQIEVDHWFWALKAITGEDPVKPEERGDLEKMRNSWLKWGKENGHT